MSLTRRRAFHRLGRFVLGGALALAIAGTATAQTPRPRLVVGTQDPGFPAIVEASGALKDAPFDLEWAVLVGPTPELAALHSGSLDVAWLGDTSLILEQARSPKDWTAETAPFRIVAAWRNTDPAYRKTSDVTAVRNSANINSLADLRGKSWAFNVGGVNHLVYALSVLKAGLTEKDVEPVILGDGHQAAAAFNSGQVDAYSGDYVRVKESLDKGEARVLLDSDELNIPGLTVFATRGDVLTDPVKSAALGDFLSRIRDTWGWYRQNLPAVETIYAEKVKFTPEKAKAQAGRNQGEFQPLDAKLLGRQQEIADILFANGIIKKKVDAAAGYTDQFARQTAPRD
ncbi:PhnD/SsuA/transferrin family substrate-binding protein [Ancylobacter sonchi]|uniref:ABC transporter substrate-binding protein n=1 Tax=Ancylobacter sonchi TaxID=1937790 RepID=UPI001BD2E6A7|nr:ABC transporter substrate-binding protein [Ancylobacter sonchi]MBS7535985.1 PhnD/SsuA/transferrin family substrate-binding protein [Ancylobacter sonchi]